MDIPGYIIKFCDLESIFQAIVTFPDLAEEGGLDIFLLDWCPTS